MRTYGLFKVEQQGGSLDIYPRDGNGSDRHGIGSGYYLLPYFNLNTNANIFEYEFKTDVLDSDFYSDVYC